MSANGIEAVGAATGDERHDMRLMTLLRSMVGEKLLKGAGETLGLDPRTVQTSMERGEHRPGAYGAGAARVGGRRRKGG